MNTPIKTNQIVYNKINYYMFDEKYNIFCVEKSKGKFNVGAYIIDAPALNKNVLSVYFTSGKKFYVMMNKNSDSTLLYKILSGAEEGKYITIKQRGSSELNDDRIILQLLLNSLGNASHPLLRFNNITGHLYCFHNDWLIHGRKDNSVLQIKCLEISISPDFRLQFDVRTFTSELLKSKITFCRKKFKDYPQYVISEHCTLRRRLKDDTGPAFIQRQTDGEKSTIPFIKFRNIKDFEKSKMGVVSSVMLRFNKTFSGIVEIGFQNIDDYISVECEKHGKAEDIKFIKTIINSQKIYIVDNIKDDESQELCKKLQNILFEEYGIKAEIRKKIVKNNMNLCLIHNAEYYIGTDDPHKQYFDAVVQHITSEDFELFNQNGKPSSVIAQAIHELMIKADLLNNKITLFDWAGMGFDHKISFIIKAEKDEQLYYFFMEINPDGGFKITEQEFTLFEQDEYSQIIDIFADAEHNSETVKGIIRDEYGNINIIKNTKWVTIPEIFKIREELEKGNTAIKNKEKRAELFPSVIDIKQFRYNDSIYYFAGAIGKGLDDITTAVNISRIDVYENSQELFSRLLRLMDVGFIHNRQLTVIPFPFKYLREYVEKLGFHIL